MQTSNAGRPDLAAALLRVSLGAMWISHALLKVLVFTMAGTSQFFVSQGLPGWLAWPVVAAEIVGGAAILAGYRGRLVSLLLLPVLAGALYVHAGNGWVFTSAGGGWEYPLFLMAMSLVHALLGDGAYAASSPQQNPIAARA
ncbi:DoxX family protein [Massilia endophytica]|uniref:DoxX family protein n=1 Tax=Massilia endophytica TaxID=2899220 RepID=UPI001E5635F8|nr:DoxX family protein [Massilia endophytica]UGQ45384.1 DoxX family protein [Massilia endophytica]